MKGIAVSVVLIVCAIATASCLTSTSGTSASPTATPTPPSANARINAINAELAAISSETTKLQDDETLTEKQRNDSLTALVAARGGPRMPQGISDGEIYVDPGMMISMHTQNLAVATSRLDEIRTKVAALTSKADKLKNDRAAIEATLPAPKGKSPIGSCFTPDTLVLTNRGKVPISFVARDDIVLTYDETRREAAYRPVIQANAGRENHYYIVNGSLRVTALHRFMTEAGWLRTSDLTVGMQLQTSEGFAAIKSIRLVSAEVAVSNLEVEQDHDFYVSDGQTAYLVHNSGGGGK